MIEEVLLGSAGAGCPGFEICEVIGERAVALLHVEKHVLGLGDSVLWLEFRLEEVEEFMSIIFAGNLALAICNHKDVDVVGDFLEVVMDPDGCIADHK